MGRPVNPNTPEDGFVSKKLFLDQGSICASDLAIVDDKDTSKKIAFDPSSQPAGTKYTVKTPAVSGDVTLTLPSASGTLVTTATETNSFSIVQPPAGTSPTASSPTDTLTLTSSDSSVTITGNSSTKTVDFKAGVVKAALIEDQKAAGTNGGTSSTGGYNDRTLNTVVQDSIGVTLSSNAVTLPAGTYLVSWYSEFFGATNETKTRIYNSTASAALAYSSSNLFASNVNKSTGHGLFTLASQSNIKLQYQVGTAPGTGFDLGHEVVAKWGGSEVEVYSSVSILKVG